MWDVVKDLEKNNQLIRIKTEVDPNLEVAEVHRQVYDKQGPAILFEKIKGSPFPALSNLYGTIDRTEFLFRKTMPKIKKVIELKADPTKLLKNPLRYLATPFTALQALPMRSWFGSPVTYGKTTIDQLPLIKSWPMDGGAFVTLPQVFTLPPGSKNPMESNIGMYRIQLSGNEYVQNEEIGLHYQLHRGIGIHHEAYNRSNEPFKCSIFVGGLPSHAFSAIMPMPEGISELTFAGMLGGKRFRYAFDEQGHFLSSDADFVITGTIIKNFKKPEGPFGDHLGYYSLTHDFPVMKVDSVYHRKNPIWHFTVVGRPPQEDSSFGYLIHKLVEDLTEQEFPGVKEIHAVDAAGVHPLLIAIGQERYMPFRDPKPEEILTIANRIIGSGQTSLAKYLIIAAFGDDPNLSTHDLGYFFKHFLERVDWTRDLHFQTKTTIDTLDYSGDDWNGGSKVVMACRGDAIRKLESEHPSNATSRLIIDSKVIMPGILGITMLPFSNYHEAEKEMTNLTEYLSHQNLDGFPLIVISDDSAFTAENINNFVWVTFTRSNPSHDIYGVHSFISHKHWGCKGSLIIDARKKPHHAPELVADENVQRKVAEWFKF
jgi:4-hydroxy-3-polyprenylbenzoate decarboxylase